MDGDPKARITEGEIYGAPVPGGWPNRGPLQVLKGALGKLLGREGSREQDSGAERPGESRATPDK